MKDKLEKDTLQTAVKIFNEKHDLNIGLSARMLDLFSELGEVSKLTFAEELGKKVEDNKWKEELGDLLYSLLCIFNQKGISTEESLEMVLKKYNQRITTTGNPDSGH